MKVLLTVLISVLLLGCCSSTSTPEKTMTNELPNRLEIVSQFAHPVTGYYTRANIIKDIATGTEYIVVQCNNGVAICPIK